MSSGSRKYLLIGCAIVLAVLASGYLGVVYMEHAAKSQLEHKVSMNLGMPITIDRMAVSLLSSSVSAKKIEIKNNGSKVFSIDTLQVKLDPLALLQGKIQVKELNFIKPEITLARLENGNLNIELSGHEKTDGTGNIFIPAVFNIEEGSLTFRDGKKLFELQGISVTTRDISLVSGRKDLQLSAQVSLIGDLGCREIKWNKTVIRDFKSHFQGTNGNYFFESILFQALGGRANGRFEAYMATTSPKFVAEFQLSDLRVEEFFATLSDEKLGHGKMELAVNLSVNGGDKQELLRSMAGKVDMTGQDIIIEKLDLDKLLEEYMHSQQFNLVDLGAFAVVGPLGPALTKTYDFSGVMRASKGGSTEVHQLVSLWQINEGRAVAQDVALTTKENRIAVKGGVDIATNNFEKLLVAVIDANGCAIVSQEMNGPFDNPEIKQPSFIETAAGPIINIFKKATRYITKSKCETIYNGSVAPPGE